MDHHLFIELSLILAIGTAISIIMKLLKQPLIIGYILTGLLVGPTVLDIVRTAGETISVSGESLAFFSEMGIALLLFLVGLGLNPKVIKEVGKVAILTGVGQFLFTTIIGFAIVSAVTDISTTGTLYIAIGLAFSSTIIILKLLSDKKELTRLHGKIATGFLIIQDILATIALVFVSANSSKGLDPTDLFMLLAKGVGLGLVIWATVKFILPLFTKTIAGNQELLFLFSIAWGIGIGALFTVIGLSLEVGALAAGIALAGFPYAQEAASRLKPLRDFFIVVFFIVLGSRLDLNGVLEVLPQAIVLSLFVIIGNPIIVMTIMGLLGYTKKTSFKTSLAVAQISEFSLVLMLLARRLDQISDSTLALMTMVGLITIAISSYIIIYDEKLYRYMEKYLSLFERRKTKNQRTSSGNQLLLFGYKKGGSEFVKVFKQMKKKYTVVDYDPSIIDALEQSDVNYLYGDMTDIELLQEVGIAEAKLVVSVVTDHETNKFLLRTIEHENPNCVVISHADTLIEAAELYAMGAGYVMLPHYIGSEKISNYIKKSGLKKSEFRKYRDKHLAYLRSHITDEDTELSPNTTSS